MLARYRTALAECQIRCRNARRKVCYLYTGKRGLLTRSHSLPALNIPTEGLTLSKLLEKGQQRCSNGKDALVNKETGERWSFAFVHKQANLLAKGLTAIGLSRGDNLVNSGIVSNVGASIYCATASLGMGFNHQHVFEPKMSYVMSTLSVVAPKVLVLGEGMNGEAFDFLVQLFDKDSHTAKSKYFPSIEFIFYDGSYKNRNPEHKFLKPLGSLIEKGKLVSDIQLAEAKAKVQPDDTVMFTFTSGSTGKPKCVADSQQSHAVRNLDIVSQEQRMSRITGSINVDELFGYHFGVLSGLLGTGTIVLMPDKKTQQFDDPNLPKFIADTINEEQVMIALFSVRHTTLLLNYVEETRVTFPSLHLLLVATQIVSEDFLDRVNKSIAKTLNVYGMSEYFPIAGTPIDDPLESSLKGKMKATEYNEIKLITESGEIAEVGEKGEILVKGPVMNVKYVNNSEANKTLLTPDGFIRTGDIAVMDSEGYITLKGRKFEAERLKVFGQAVYPGPIENAMGKHPQVLEVAVISGKETDWRGAEVVYCFLLKEGVNHMNEEEIMNMCKKEEFRERQWPARIFYFSSFPTTDNMRKVSKSKLRDSVLNQIQKDHYAGMTNWYKSLETPFTNSHK